MKNTKTMADHGLENTPSMEAAELDALLAQLASAASAQSAPSAVRQRLLAEARLQAKLPLRPQPRLATFLAGALSAILLIGATGAGVSLVLGRSRLFSTVRATLRSPGIEKTPSPSATLPFGGGDTATLPVSGPVSRDDDFLLLAESPGSSSDTTLASEVFTLPDSDTAIANGTEATVRVSVPASQLLAWGVPSPVSGLDDEVPADLLLGDDGLPQAIRVLPASTTTSSPTTEETYP